MPQGHWCNMLHKITVYVAWCAVNERVRVFHTVKRKGCSNDDVIARRIMSNHVFKMAAVATDDRQNTLRIRVIVPDVKFQVGLHAIIYMPYSTRISEYPMLKALLVYYWPAYT